MKQLLVFLSFLTAIPVLAQDNIQLSGQVLNPTSGYVQLSRFSGILLQNGKQDSLKLDAQGRFSMTLPWPKARKATFTIGENYTKLFLTPGDHLVMTADAKKLDETIKYTGRGSTINSYMAQSTVAEKKKWLSKKQPGILSEAEFTQYSDSIKTSALAQLDRQLGHPVIEPTAAERAFITEEKNDILYEWADKRLSHAMYRKQKDKSKPLPPLSAGYFDFLKEVPLAPDIYTSAFMIFSLNYATYLAEETIKKQPALKDKNETLLRYEQIEQHLSGQPKRVVLAWLLQEVVMLEMDKSPLQATYQRYLSDPQLEPEIRDFIVSDWTSARRYKRL